MGLAGFGAMGRKQTPPPESGFIGIGGIFVGAMALPAVLAYRGGWWWCMIVTALPLAIYILYIVYGIVLLSLAWGRWHGSEIRGILVHSNSPNWKEYIEAEWIPRIGDKVISLNWSERKRWPRTLPVALFSYFGESADNFNFNPLVIIFRGIRYPLVYRFFYALRDAKHDNYDALRRLEEHLFSRLE